MKTVLYKFVFPFILFVFIHVNLYPQQLEWAVNTTGLGGDSANDMVLDKEKNLYIIGNFSGSVDFDPFGTYVVTVPLGMYIQKLDHTGDLIWLKYFSSSSGLSMTSMTMDSASNLYLVGHLSGTIDIDPGPDTILLTGGGTASTFILSLNKNGDFRWAKSLSGGTSRGSSITSDINGNVYVVGHFHGTLDLDPGMGTTLLVSHGMTDVFIQKLDSLGNFIWAKQIGSTGNDDGYDITFDKDHKLLITGKNSSTADLDTTGDTLAGGPGFLVRMDILGNFDWFHSIAVTKAPGKNKRNGVDENGNIFIGGIFAGTRDFDPGPDTFNLTTVGTYNSDAVMLELDSTGNFVTAYVVGGTNISPDVYYFTAFDEVGNIYTVGKFSDTVDLDPGPGEIISGTEDNAIFLQKISPGGELLWVGQMDGFSMEPSAFFIDGNALYMSGHFLGAMDFDPGPGVYYMSTSGDKRDEFIAKFNLQTMGLEDREKENLFSVFPNPSSGTFTIDLNENVSGAQIEVIHASGQLVQQKTISESKTTLTIDGPVGLYFISVINGDQQVVMKVVKQ